MPSALSNYGIPFGQPGPISGNGGGNWTDADYVEAKRVADEIKHWREKLKEAQYALWKLGIDVSLIEKP